MKVFSKIGMKIIVAQINKNYLLKYKLIINKICYF